MQELDLVYLYPTDEQRWLGIEKKHIKKQKRSWQWEFFMTMKLTVKMKLIWKKINWKTKVFRLFSTL